MAGWTTRERALGGGLLAASAAGLLLFLAFQRVVGHPDDETKHPVGKLEAVEARVINCEKDIGSLRATMDAQREAAENERKRVEQQAFWRDQRKAEGDQMRDLLRGLVDAINHSRALTKPEEKR